MHIKASDEIRVCNWIWAGAAPGCLLRRGTKCLSEHPALKKVAQRGGGGGGRGDSDLFSCLPDLKCLWQNYNTWVRVLSSSPYTELKSKKKNELIKKRIKPCPPPPRIWTRNCSSKILIIIIIQIEPGKKT